MRYNFQNNINAKLSNSSKLSLRLNVQLRDMTTPNQGVGAIFNNAMNTSPVEFPVYFPDDGEIQLLVKFQCCNDCTLESFVVACSSLSHRVGLIVSVDTFCGSPFNIRCFTVIREIYWKFNR